MNSTTCHRWRNKEVRMQLRKAWYVVATSRSKDISLICGRISVFKRDKEPKRWICVSSNALSNVTARVHAHAKSTLVGDLSIEKRMRAIELIQNTYRRYKSKTLAFRRSLLLQHVAACVIQRNLLAKQRFEDETPMQKRGKY